MNTQEILKYYKLDILHGANLYGANLRGVNLRGANLHGANLYRANLYRANLSEADLHGANLSEADLCWANLCWANLSRADLSGTDLSGTKINYTIGNSKEIKTLLSTIWHISWTKNNLAIGCEQHTIKKWWSFSDTEINIMDSRALVWWKIYKPILQQLINK